MNSMKYKAEFVIYDDGRVALDAMIEGESIWLNQKQIAELFDVKVPAVSKHLKNIFKSGELDEEVVVSKMETTTRHGAITGKTQTKNINFYNLDSIISIGYKVNRDYGDFQVEGGGGCGEVEEDGVG